MSIQDTSGLTRDALLQQMNGGTADGPKPGQGVASYTNSSGGAGEAPVDNSVEGIAALNAAHPEYGGGTPLDQTPAKTYSTKLMEGDPSKFTAEHMAKSPKYDFLNLARSNKYDYTQMGDMLKELQGGANGRLWQGWTADGKGNLVFAGDPSQLANEWNGVKRVDAVGAYGNLAQGKEAAGWRWGVDDPGGGGPSAGGPQSPPLQNGMQPGTGGDMSGDALMSSLNQGVPTDNSFYQQLLERARGYSGPTDRAALLAQMRPQ